MRNRSVKSVKDELVKKSREAMLAAVQIYNNPHITFKSEAFITLTVISWTYLLHAYYRKERIDYRYYEQKGKKRAFDKTKYGAIKHWELERCLNDKQCPLDRETILNLRFLIGVRHEIEHQMTNKIDEYLSAKLQACALNYNQYLCELFGERYGVGQELSLAIQFAPLSVYQREVMLDSTILKKNVKRFIADYESDLSDEVANSTRYAYRVLFVPVNVNRKGQADQVIEFIKPDSPMAAGIEKQYVMTKETEKKKCLPSEIVAIMQKEGFPGFKTHNHTGLWKANDAKNPNKHYGVQISKAWYWYETWVTVVRQHCQKEKERYQ